ncbi:MAG: alpha-N-acetylglucosaminidase C-terminal domain-containing protein [Candidatus Hydrogenedentes bacterium]|nr:alpha-N-acetylglucosaminidase C-terminal domain-containing protein [Candidatus Hydrogenedentota bacterium]
MLHLFILVNLMGAFAPDSVGQAAETAISGIVVAGEGGGDASDSEAYRVSIASAELVKYLGAMSGKKVCLQGPDDPIRAKTVLVVGNASQNRLAAALVARKVVDLTLPSDDRDAFVVRCGKDDGHAYLVFAGANGLGTLYAVYHYLENCCDVGAFMDGEHVPKRKTAPVEGVNIAETPRFRDRHFGFSVAYGMKKYFNQFRTAEEMNQLMDWMVKRKLNRTGWGFYAYPGGTESGAVFGYECKPEEDYGAGWPRAWTFSPEYRTKMLQEWFTYARARGIQFYYALEFGLVPVSYRQKHPELPYVPNLGYDANVIQPDSPECLAVMKQYLNEIVRLYGTDHLYQATPFCESTGGATPDAAFEVKLKAARSLCNTLFKLDPKYVWQSDSWDFGAVLSVWTPDRLAKYFDELKPLQDRMYVYDTTSDGNPFWNRTKYFGGVPWAFGVLHSFQGDDYLHGDMPRIIRQTCEAANDPGSTNLKGMYHIPESFGHNVMFFQLTTALAWGPNGVDLEKFVQKYCRTRYDRASYKAMLECTRTVVDAAYRGGGMDVYYQRMGITYNPAASAPFDDFIAYQRLYPELCREIPLMEQAVEKALGEAWRERGNKLFENDLVDYTRTMLGLKSNYCMIEAYRAFKVGKRATFEKNAAVALRCLDGIATILSTRPDFSIQKTIDDAMAIPGTNPFVPRMVRKHAINDMYAPVENFEQLVLFSKPRVEAYFNEMRARMERGDTSFPRASMNAAFGALEKHWWENDIVIPDSARFKGTTLEAVRAMRDVAPMDVAPAPSTVDLKTDQIVACTPNLPSELRPLGWEDGRLQTVVMDGRTVWKVGDPALGMANKHLYFLVDASVALNCQEPVALTVQYLDKGKGLLVLEYDGYDSDYAAAEPIALRDSGEWKTAKITLPHPQFTKSQNAGADFRLSAENGPILVAGVAIASPHTTALPTFEQVKGSAK